MKSEVIVIGGGISAHGDHLLPLVDRAMEERFGAAFKDRVTDIVVSPGGPDGGAVGAAVLGAEALLTVG